MMDSNKSSRELFSQHLTEALPYIREFYGKTIVVKYGGAAMTQEGLKTGFCRDIALLRFVGLRPVVVHGGGPKVTELMNRLGKDAQFVDGLRVTDKETVDIAEMVLCGLVGKEIVAKIAGEGGKAVGLSGKDGGLILTRRKEHIRELDSKPVDIGYVGEVVKINPEVLHALDKAEFIPVISPLGMSEEGHAYNINADTVAGEIAHALSAERLILLTDTPGILLDVEDPESLCSSLTPERIAEMRADGTISKGMLPKVEACLRALDGGVRKTHIVDGRVPNSLILELFTNEGIGTEIAYPAEPGGSA